MTSEQLLADITASRPSRWGVGLVVALLGHLAIAAAVVNYRESEQAELSGAAPTVLAIAEFAAAPSTPSASSPNSASAAQLSEPTPEPAPELEAPNSESLPEPEPEPTEEVEPEKEPEHEPEEPEPTTSGKRPLDTMDQIEMTGTASAAQRADSVQAPEAGESDSQWISQQKVSWEGQLAAHLERHKRYPYPARTRREEGVALLRFTLDRKGRVVSAKLEKSSGYFLLDREAEAMLKRAEPLPAPPKELRGKTLELVLPIEFALR